MGRWREPAKPGTALITAQGYETLQQELEGLWTRRALVTKALAAAAAEGDRSENAEYIYRKKELAGIDRRIRYLNKRLPTLTVVREIPADQDRVFLGAYVQLEDEQAQQHCYRLVGPDEADLKKNWVSIDSPMARALLNKCVDDEIRVQTPNGESSYLIVSIEYRV